MPKHNTRSKDVYARKPIHPRAENKETVDEEEEYEEEEEEEYKNVLQRKKLYPDLEEDMLELRKPQAYEQSDTHTRKPPDVSSGGDFKYFFLVLLLVVAAIAACFSYSIPKKQSVEINVADLVVDMQNHFKGQQSHTFNLLNKTLMKVVNNKPEPRAPAIITLIADKGAEKTASDFSMRLAEALAPAQFVSIRDSMRWRGDPDSLKRQIDEEIKSKLRKDILNVVIVDRLNDVPIEAAMLFHGLCDHEFAPYKRAVYLFIVHLDSSIPEDSSFRDIDEVAMKSMRNIWRASTGDLVDSLITRITVSVVNIK